MKQNGNTSTPPRKSTVVIGAADRAAKRRQRKSDAEGQHIDALRRNTHRNRSLAVVPHGPHPDSELCVQDRKKAASAASETAAANSR